MIETAAPARRAARLPDTPYVGLVPYDEDDAPFFFGRDEEKQIVAGNLRSSRLTILYGPSGVGKTSLLQAGVVHDLHEQVLARAAAQPERAPFAICACRGWRDDPLQTLADAIHAAAGEALGDGELPPWRPGEPLVDALRAWTQRVRTLYVVLDQFEDYFLYHPDAGGEDAFAAEFARIVNDPNLRVNFLLSIREDAWAKLDRFEGRIPGLFANYVRVEHLDREAAREAIEGPVEEWNRRLPPDEAPYSVEPALVEAVVDAAAAGTLALTEGGDGALPEASRADAVEAPFLQLVMERLWRATVEAGARELTLARLEQLGGAQQIVESHLLEALGWLSDEEQATAADLFRFLVTRSKTKIAHPASDLAEWTKRPEPEVVAVLDKLCRGESGRILRRVSAPGGSEATRYELFHDVLAEPILEWRRGYEQERDRRATRRRFARIGGGLLVLVALFAALAIVAVVQRGEARHATRKANQATRKANDATNAAKRLERNATSLALASAANAQLARHVDVSLLLALEANKVESTADARSSMISALEVARGSGADAILRSHSSFLDDVAFSGDGRVLASVGDGGLVRLWDPRTRRPLRSLSTENSTIDTVAFSPHGDAIAFPGGKGRVALAGTSRDVGHRVLRNLGDGHARIKSIAFSPDGHTLAAAGADRTVRLWNWRTGKLLGRVRHPAVESVAFSPNGRVLASAGGDRAVRLWDVGTRAPHGRPFLDGRHIRFTSVAFSPNGRTIAAVGEQGTVRLLDLGARDVRVREPVGLLLHGYIRVESVTFSPNGRTFASAGDDGTVRLWRTRDGKQLRRLHISDTTAVFGVAFSPDGRTLASAGGDGTVRLWNLHTRKHLPRRLPIWGKSVSFSPDGGMLAAVGYDRAVRLWDVRARKHVRPDLQGAGEGQSVAFGRSGETLAVAGRDGTVLVWSARAHRRLRRLLQGHTDPLFSVAFSRNRPLLAAAGDDGKVWLWNARTLEKSGKSPPRHLAVESVAFSPNEPVLASGDRRGQVRLWDVRTRTESRLPLRHTGSVDDVAFSPDGRILASAGGDGTIRLWDVHTRRPLGRALRGHAGAVNAVAFSRDGRTIASAGRDRRVRLWDVGTQKEIGQPFQGRRGFTDVAFSPDGRTLASAGGTVRLWEGIFWRSPKDLQNQVCGLVVGNLTSSEWEQFAPGLTHRTTCRAARRG